MMMSVAFHGDIAKSARNDSTHIEICSSRSILNVMLSLIVVLCRYLVRIILKHITNIATPQWNIPAVTNKLLRLLLFSLWIRLLMP